MGVSTGTTRPTHVWFKAAALGTAAAALIGAVGYGTSLWFTAQRLQSQIRQASDYLDAYLSQSRRVLRIMKLLAERDGIDLHSEAATAQALWKLANRYSDVGYLNYGLSNGDFRGVGQLRSQSGKLIFERSDSSRFDRLQTLSLGDKGVIGQQIMIKPWSDFRSEDWYRKPLGQSNFTWAGIYNWTDDPAVMVIGAGIGISRNGRPYGTAGVDLFTDDISSKLQQIVGSSGDALAITEPNGLVVATSTRQLPFEITDATVKRFRLGELSDPHLRLAAGRLSDPAAAQNNPAFVKGTLIATSNWIDGMGLQLNLIAAAPCSSLLWRWLAVTVLLASVITLGAGRRMGQIRVLQHDPGG